MIVQLYLANQQSVAAHRVPFYQLKPDFKLVALIIVIILLIPPFSKQSYNVLYVAEPGLKHFGTEAKKKSGNSNNKEIKWNLKKPQR